MTKSNPKTTKIKILKRSEPVPQSLIKPESGILKSKGHKNKTVTASEKIIPKGVKPKVLNDQRLLSIQPKVQGRKSKTSRTNSKGPTKIWVPKSELINTAGVPKGKREIKVLVPRQRVFKAYDRRESFVPHLYHERWRISEVCWQPNWKYHWYSKTNCTLVNKDDKSITFKGKRVENVYKINFFDLADQNVVCLLSMNDKKWVWHRR
ncbi:hypothetical protein MTR_1g052980 [Medicago truncatula]|uniref:Uncharacterized protein n=1 Tax=Medicago truncatula TaxID=3880 RepID=A0A072VJL3_MEDTR|nr:hypothetical protein MTR_1g052980 [Medicago truncatula]